MNKEMFAAKALKIVNFSEKAIALGNILSCDCNFVDEMLSEIADMLIEFAELRMTDSAYEEFWENVNKLCREKSVWEDFYNKYKA